MWQGTYKIWQNKEFCKLYAQTSHRQLHECGYTKVLVSQQKYLGNTTLYLYNPLSSDWTLPVDSLAKELGVARVWAYLTQPCLEKEAFLKEEFHTTLIPLHEGEEKLWKRVGDKTRNMVRKGKKAGVEVSLAETQEDFEGWWAVYHQLTQQIGFQSQNYDFCKKLFETPSLSKLFVARLGSKIIGGCFFLTDDYPLYWLGAFDRAYQKTSAGHVTMWEAMLYFMSHGCSLLDLGGISVGETDGPSRFKKNFGGDLQKAYIYEWPVSKMKNCFLKVASKLRTFAK